MSEPVTLLSAWLVGFFGSVHCVGMCGGIVGALCLGLDGRTPSRSRFFTYVAFYNTGRIASYALAGAIVGLLGQTLLDHVFQDRAQRIGIVIAGLFMLALGLYISGWWRGLILLEKGGAKLWRYLEPIGRRFLPARTPLQALALGLIWGWLPCGMVYSMLAWTLAAGSAGHGALLMAAFGLGTLPLVLALGLAAPRVNIMARDRIWRIGAAVLVMFAGVYLIIKPDGVAHVHHGMATFHVV